MSTSANIQEIKARADIVAVISRYVKLKKAGRNFTGLCPFHNEKTPSFHVTPTLGIYKCFGCGAAGDVIKFVQDIEHLDFPQTLEKLAGELGITLQKNNDPAFKRVSRFREAYKVAAEFFHYLLMKHPQGATALHYAKTKRKLTEKSLIQYQVGYAPAAKDVLQKYLKKKGFTEQEIRQAGFVNEKGNDKYTDRLVFPVYDTAGHVVGFSGRVIAGDDPRPKFLNSGETELFKKRYILFNLNFAKEAISKKDMAILCEGQIDAVISSQVGVANIVAPLGTSLTDTQLSVLSRFTKNVAFCFDNDGAGQKSISRGAQLAFAQDLNPLIIPLPEDCNDVDDLIKKRPDDWIDRAAHPIEFITFRLTALKALLKQNIKEFENQLHELLQIVSVSTPLRQQLLARQIAEALSLSEESLLQSIAKKSAPSFVRQEIKQKQGAISTAEYVLSIIFVFPLVTSMMGKAENAVRYFPAKEQQEVFRLFAAFAEKQKHLVTSVLDKKTKKLSVSWESVYTRFTNEVALEFSSWIAEIAEKQGELVPLLERLGLSEVTSSVVITDEVIQDYFRAWNRLKKQTITLRLEVLRKKMVQAEHEEDDEKVTNLSKQIQEEMLLLRKIEKLT